MVTLSATVFEILTFKARKQSLLCLSHPGLTPLLGVTPFEFCDEIWHQKTRVVGLPDGEEIMMFSSF